MSNFVFSLSQGDSGSDIRDSADDDEEDSGQWIHLSIASQIRTNSFLKNASAHCSESPESQQGIVVFALVQKFYALISRRFSLIQNWMFWPFLPLWCIQLKGPHAFLMSPRQLWFGRENLIFGSLVFNSDELRVNRGEHRGSVYSISCLGWKQTDHIFLFYIKIISVVFL